MIGTNELIIIAVVVLVLFGASAIPKFAKSLGQAKKEFETAAKESKGEAKEAAVASAKSDDQKKS